MPRKPCEPGCACKLHPAGNVSNAVFREALEQRMAASQDPKACAKSVCFEVDLVRRRRPKGPGTPEYEIADTSTLFRALGMRPVTSNKPGYRATRRTINPDLALRLGNALDIDPTEAPV